MPETAVAVKERPIIFSTAMVQALLSDSKTQTRRIVKPPRWARGRDVELGEHGMAIVFDPKYETHNWIPCPYASIDVCFDTFRPRYSVGERLWVRETWGAGWLNGDGHYYAIRPTGKQHELPDKIFYKADGKHDDESEGRYCWRPSIHMPRWASRITLEVTGVRVERVQDISHRDALAEGVEYDLSKPDGSPLARFKKLWDKINGPGSWESNPWVWVISFKRLEKAHV